MGSSHMFSHAPLGKLPFRSSDSATASVQKSTHCMEVPVNFEQGLQKSPCLLSRPLQHPGWSSLPLSRVSPSQSSALPAPASPAWAGGGQSAVVPMSPSSHRSLPLPSESIYFTQAQEGCSGLWRSRPARSWHQTPSRSFAHPSPGFQHALMLQITWQTPKRLQTLTAPFKREQYLCWENHEHCHLLVRMSERGGLRWC